ncbi:MAG: PQQ-dependent sugar dehydrogenase [Planctomycetaceae bacterium]|nr:PQQ-dependent sugar dehydrogenase [Planctomycetaceae bacterium]
MPIVPRPFLPALILALAAPLTSVLAEQAPNTLSEAEKRAGWKLLFDGTSAGAFRSFRQESLNAGWKVHDGAVVRAARGAGDIVTRDQFEAFELQLEYRIAPGGNSGIMFHVTEEENAPWKTGPEVQVLDNAAGKDPQKSGWLYQLYAPLVPDWVRKLEEAVGRKPPQHLDATRPAGTWNHVYLRVAPGDGEVAVNGVVYERFQKGSKDWHERVAKSKFAAFPKFGRADRGHVCLQDHGDEVAYRSIKVRNLPADGGAIPFADGTAAVAAVPALPDATWEGWSPESKDGTPVVPLRPIVVTHSGDGSGRRFVLDQAGMIHVFKPGAVAGKLFLDLRPGTSPWGTYNEEGLLGLAFHPRFKDNGEFFVTYSLKGEKRVERLARFKVSRTDPDRADPASEEIVLAVDQPFWNHNGGSIAFGPDGFLYWGLGDGGSRDDPFGNGQRLDTLLGKILRIDVDRRAEGKAYAIPADNPFAGRANARGEIFAFGFRNPWQIAFDVATGTLWAADVGQDQLEEVNIVTKGGNYGWSVREGTRPFGNRPEVAGPLVDSVWEYDHRVGKSIVGGFVYRGQAIPELVGAYLYGDFVSGRLWALNRDPATGRVTNLTIPWSGQPIFGFGSDADGEAYVLTSSPTGQGVFRLASATKAATDSTGRGAIPRPDDAPQPLSPAASRQTFRLPAGLSVELIAAEPLINEPSGVCWDARGRLFVSELHGYNLEGQFDIEELNKAGRLDTQVRRITAGPEAKEKAAAATYGTVKLLTDTDGDGRMDKATVFADRLPGCYGICPARDGIIAVAAPQIIFLADRDGDGVAEIREVLFEGLAAGIFERGVSQPQWGHDDWIYAGASGSGGGRITGPRLAAPVDLPMCDFRFKADGSAIEPLVGFTQTFGLTFTDRGEKLVINTTTPVILSAPVPWQALVRNPDYALGSVQRKATRDERAYPTSRPHPWRTKRAENAEFAEFYRQRYGVAESAASGYFTSLCGPLFYDDTALPGLAGQCFACEPSQNIITRGALVRDKGTMKFTRIPAEAESEFFTSTDVWFHAIALAHAPDGGMAVVDFYREIIEDYSAIPRYLQQQYELDHGKDRGRIWKIVPEKRAPQAAADMSGLDTPALVQELASERFWRRQTARRLLVQRGDVAAAVPLIRRLITPTAVRTTAINALRTLESLGMAAPQDVRIGLRHPDAAVRIHAVAIAEPQLADPELRAAVRGLAEDPDADVVRRVAIALGGVNDPQALDTLAEIARRSGDVPWMDAAVMTGLAGRAGRMLDALLSKPEAIGKAGALVGPLATAIAARRAPDEFAAAIAALARCSDESLRKTAWQGLRNAFNAPVAVNLEPATVAAVRAATADADPVVAAAARDLVRLMKIETGGERERRIAGLTTRVGETLAEPESRLAAVRELASENDPAVTAALIRNFEAATPVVREAILEACFARTDRLPAVVDALEAGALPASACTAMQRTALERHPDATLARRAHAQFAKLVANVDGQIAEYSQALARPRDRARGAALFKQHCGVCHQAHGLGVVVGPSLTAEAQQPEQTLLLSILAPSAQISGGYTSYTLVTTGGQVFTGLLAAETASSVTLKQQEGKTRTVLRKDIEELSASPVSLMPDSLARVLTPQDVADILAWLRDPSTGDGAQ